LYRYAEDAREFAGAAYGYRDEHEHEIVVDEGVLLLQQYEREMKRMARQIEEIKTGKPAGGTSAGGEPVPRIVDGERKGGGQRVVSIAPPQHAPNLAIRIGVGEVRPPQTSQSRQSVPSSTAATGTRTGGGNSNAPLAPQPTPASATTPGAGAGYQSSARPAPPPATTPGPGPFPAGGSAALMPPSPSSPSSPSAGVKPRVRWQHPEHLDLENASSAAAPQSSAPRWPGAKLPQGTPQSASSAVLSFAAMHLAGMSRNRGAPSAGGGGAATAAGGDGATAAPAAPRSWTKLSDEVNSASKASVLERATSALSGMARSRR
jgi:hypothetical protein